MRTRRFGSGLLLALLTCAACGGDEEETFRQGSTAISGGGGGDAGAGGDAGSGGEGGKSDTAGAGGSEELGECKGLAFPCIGSAPDQVCKLKGEKVVCECKLNAQGRETVWVCTPPPM